MTKQTILAYHASAAYGPTVRLDTDSLADLMAVRELFGRLAAGDTLEEELGRALTCQLDSIRSLIVRAVQHRPSKALLLEYCGPGGPVFRWSNTPEDWLECAAKVDALMASDSPGHQYMTTEGVDDALVEICFRE
jgi:hypothetical protein